MGNKVEKYSAQCNRREIRSAVLSNRKKIVLRRNDWWFKIAESMSKMREENYLKAWFSRIDSLASWTKVISVQYRE